MGIYGYYSRSLASIGLYPTYTDSNIISISQRVVFYLTKDGAIVPTTSVVMLNNFPEAIDYLEDMREWVPDIEYMGEIDPQYTIEQQ